MSEPRKKRNSEIINELSTSERVEYLTPERWSGRKRENREEEEGWKQGDRFIPHRGSAISRQLFNMPETLLASPSDVSNKNEREQNSLIFENLLEQQLLNLQGEQVSEMLQEAADSRVAPSAPLPPGKLLKMQTTPVKKMQDQPLIIKRPKLLSFSDRKEKEEPQGMFDSKVIQSIRNMRRISRAPYKILDAPGLLDDFYQVDKCY